MSIVYFFGAGATRAIIPTAPLTSELLEEALNLFRRGRRPRSRSMQGQLHQERVRRLLKFIDDFYLQPGHTSDWDNSKLPSLEDLLSQIDLALEESRPLGNRYTLDTIRNIRDDLVYALCRTLKWKLDEEHIPAYSSYLERNQNAGVLERFFETLDEGDTIVTSNYDLVLDNALSRSQPAVFVAPRYTPEARFNIVASGEPIPNPVLHFARMPSILKLHGSLNWLYCSVCQEIDITVGEKGVLTHIYDAPTPLKCSKCGSSYEPLIITPTLVKVYRNILLSLTWKAAEESIASADELAFLGYALPEGDVHIRCMIQRALYRNYGVRGRRNDRCRITLVTREEGPSPATRERYCKAFGNVDIKEYGVIQFMQDRIRAEENELTAH
jgi:SIR2-like domain